MAILNTRHYAGRKRFGSRESGDLIVFILVINFLYRMNFLSDMYIRIYDKTAVLDNISNFRALVL